MNSTAIDLLKKNKVRLQSLAAAVIVAGSLTGCEKDKPHTPAEQYINNSIVITSNTGEKYIVRKIDKAGCDDRNNKNHYHYYDVITKSYYSDSEACKKYTFFNDINPLNINVINTENIEDYLTVEEITKLMKDELSIDDCAEIIARIKESNVEEVKTK